MCFLLVSAGVRGHLYLDTFAALGIDITSIIMSRITETGDKVRVCVSAGVTEKYLPSERLPVFSVSLMQSDVH